METRTETELAGARGRIVVHEWRNPDARFVVLLSHGYGEHAGRYEHVARRLVEEGAAVYAPDHLGHGKSEGERVEVSDGEDFSNDLHLVAERARAEHPELPVVLLRHPMGGLIAARYRRRTPGVPDALLPSGPAIGGSPELEMLLALDPIPDGPIAPKVLSRAPAPGRAYPDDPLVWHGPFKRSMLQAMVTGVQAVADGPPLGDVPTLWIHGAEDQLIPLAVTREAIQRVKGSRFEERAYEGARHEIFNETNKEEVLDDVVAFIQRALAG